MILLKIDNQALRKKLNHIQLVFFILAALWKKKKKVRKSQPANILLE